jgi:ParB family chromosome partitioning protein
LVKKITEPKRETTNEKSEEKANIDPNVRAALDELERALGTKVRLIPSSQNGGKLEIQYYSQEDLDRIYSVIVK